MDAMPNRPEIRHGASLNPCYKAAIDVVEMPNMGQFEDAEAYFAALHHELLHSTGHKTRLNRFEKRGGESREEQYGFEELVAELGAAFLAATCGLDNSSRLDDASAVPCGLDRGDFGPIRSCSFRRPARRRRRPISSWARARRRPRTGEPPREAGSGALRPASDAAPRL